MPGMPDMLERSGPHPLQVIHGLVGEALFRQALRHRSDRSGPSSERLEWLGDSVLDLLVAEDLLDRHPDWDEGRLSQERARLVRTSALALLGRLAGVAERITSGGGERQLQQVRSSDKAIADACEALIGAGYDSGGLPTARRVIEALGLSGVLP